MRKTLRQIGVLATVSVGMWLLLGLLWTGPAKGFIPEAVGRWSWVGGAVFTCFASGAMALLWSETTWAKRQPVGAMLISMGLRTGIPLCVALVVGVLATFFDAIPRPEMRIFLISFVPAYAPVFAMEVRYTYRNLQGERTVEQTERTERRAFREENSIAERKRGGDDGGENGER